MKIDFTDEMADMFCDRIMSDLIKYIDSNTSQGDNEYEEVIQDN